MTFTTTLTKKGQMTLPKQLRVALKVSAGQKLTLTYDEKEKSIKIKGAINFANLSKMIGKKTKLTPLEARNFMEKNYDNR